MYVGVKISQMLNFPRMNCLLRSYQVFCFTRTPISFLRCGYRSPFLYSSSHGVTACSIKFYRPSRFCCNQELQVADSDDVSFHKNECDLLEIAGGDKELEKKIKILILEIDVLRQEGHRVPDHLKPPQWKDLLGLKTRSQRSKYLQYLWQVQMKKLNRLKKKAERKEAFLAKTQTLPEENQQIQYGLSKNTIFLRVYDKTINHFYHSRLVTAMLFGQKVVFDCGYDSYMDKREAQNCGKQLMLLFAENRLHDEPFDLYFCNINRESESMKQLHRFVPPLYEDHFPLNLTEKSYLEIFPKEKLVYLTPHCKEELLDYDHDAVYIVGAVVDKKPLGPISLAKAKKEGLKMAKLPLDRYLAWGAGSGKSLTLDKMMQILLDIKKTGDWVKALSHVPRRKLALDHEDHFKGIRKNFEFSTWKR